LGGQFAPETGGQFPPDSGGQFPPESIGLFLRIVVVNNTGFSSPARKKYFDHLLKALDNKKPQDF
jgi:hypothetical protein